MLPAIGVLVIVLVFCVFRIKLAGDEVHALFRTLDVEPDRLIPHSWAVNRPMPPADC